MKYTISENTLKPEDFVRLFESAGWGKPALNIAKTALENSFVTFEVRDGDKTIAMVRLLGDGAMAYFMKDLIVDPDYQGQGIGAALLSHIENYIAARTDKDWPARFQLMSAKNKDGFYEKMGLTKHPHEHGGAGFTKMISGEIEL